MAAAGIAYSPGGFTLTWMLISFQAPSLYRALGYQVRLELHGFAPGIVKYTMVREPG